MQSVTVQDQTPYKTSSYTMNTARYNAFLYIQPNSIYELCWQWSQGRHLEKSHCSVIHPYFGCFWKAEAAATTSMAQPSNWEAGGHPVPTISLCPSYLISAKSSRFSCSRAEDIIRKLENGVEMNCSPVSMLHLPCVPDVLQQQQTLLLSTHISLHILPKAGNTTAARKVTHNKTSFLRHFCAWLYLLSIFKVLLPKAKCNPCSKFKWPDWWRLWKISCLYNSLLTFHLKTYPLYTIEVLAYMLCNHRLVI